MKTRPAYLVIDTNGRQPTIVRTRQSWPSLDPGEIAVRIALEFPDELLPQIQEFTVDELDSFFTIKSEPVEVPVGDRD
jgi:hypothetical protein